MNRDGKNEWWGYLHINGSIQAKRAFYDLAGDMAEARASDMVQRTAGPVMASSRQQAIAILRKELI